MSATSPTPTLTRADYVSAEVFEQERRRIFHGGWFFVGHVASIPSGATRVVDVAGEQVIVTCTRTGQFHAFANACRHRGAMLVDPTDPTVVAPECGAASIQCPYHAWTYGLDGRLLATPRVDRSDVDRDSTGLWAHRAEVWNGLIFVSLERDVAPLHDWLVESNPALIEFDHLEIAEMALVQRTASSAAANWKIVVENYQECLHCPVVHPELVEVIPHYRTGEVVDADRPDGSVEFVNQASSYTHARSGAAALPPLPGIAPSDEGVYNGASVFPNLLFDLTASGLVLTTLFPVSPDRTEIVGEYLFAREVADSSEYDPTDEIAFNELIGAQDIAVCERVQRGVASRAFTTGILTTKDDAVVDFNRQYRTVMDPAIASAFESPNIAGTIRPGVGFDHTETGEHMATDRRQFIHRSAQLGVLLGAGVPLLQACGSSDSGGSGDSKAVTDCDRGRARAGGWPAPNPELRRLRQPRHRRLVRGAVRREARDHHLRCRRRSDHEAGQRLRRCRRVPVGRTEHARPADRRRPVAAAEHVVHPEQGQRAVVVRQPVVRRGLRIHRALHRLLVRHRLPHRSHRPGQGRGAGLGHPLGPRVQGRHLDPRRLPRRDLDGAAACGHHRRQHHRQGADRTGRRGSRRTHRVDEHQGQHRGLQGHPRRRNDARAHVERRPAGGCLLVPARGDRPRPFSVGGIRRTASASSTTTA